jgi:hypothetical protein
VRIESILIRERYCPPLTPETFAAGFAAARDGRGDEERLDYAARAGRYATFHPAANGGVEIVVWGMDVSQPDADHTGKFERRSIFLPSEVKKAQEWVSDQVEGLIWEAGIGDRWRKFNRKKPVAVNKLRYNEPLDRARKAKNVNLQFLGEVPGVDPVGGRFRSYRFIAGEHDTRYAIEVRLYGRVNGLAPAWVNCECGDHRYKWEWALASRESAGLVHALDQRPVVRNPALLKATCKHVHAALEWLRWEKGA